MSSEIKKVMVSSTIRDLPEHRQQVMEACLDMKVLPIMMEHLPASYEDAISVSKGMVADAELYLGIFAFRYGYIPKINNPEQISITEIEYSFAVKLEIPRLIFFMSEDNHSIFFSQVEMGNGAEKLRIFKEKIRGDEKVFKIFSSPHDLRASLIHSLHKFLMPPFDFYNADNKY